MTATVQEQSQIPAGRWKADPVHTSVEFGIRHLLITTVRGRFADVEGLVEVDEHGPAKALATIRAESVDTNQPQRDEHLRSPDFFDATGFPEIRFESNRLEHLEGSRFQVLGDLTIKGTTREIELEAEFTGLNRDPYGNDRLGLTIRGQLDPNDYGVDWNQELETGGNLIGDRVDFVADVSAIREVTEA
jgi:polyisoprenoid-binding protein YceI